MRRILVTGGAGFIGSHLADLLLEQGYSVRVLDSLSPQVHGDDEVRPAYLAPEVELVRGDVRDPLATRRALDGVDAVVHLAAAVGVGQSMYKIADYVGINDLGTAVLLEALTNHPVGRLLVASSMSVYGEGLYRSTAGERFCNVRRILREGAAEHWDPTAPDGTPLTPIPTDETKPVDLASIYALT
jgi:dTDP-L-rhamnose 4-epimerase